MKKNKKLMPVWLFLLLTALELITVWFFYVQVSHFIGWFFGVVFLLLIITHDIPRLFINQEDLDKKNETDNISIN